MESRRSLSGTSAIALLSLLMALLLCPALWAGEREDAQAARKSNTTGAWASYLKKYPRGASAREARDAHDSLVWQEAEKSAGDPAALEALFRQCKTPGVSDRVFRLWDDALWMASQAADTAEAYRTYLLRFPAGQHEKDAKAALEETAWRACREAATSGPCDAYLKEYRSGAHATEAREVVRSLAFKTAMAKDTIEGYEEFLRGNRGTEEIEKRLHRLRYERALKTGTLESWKAYHDAYRFSRWTDNDKETSRMKEEANKEIERLLYERIMAEPSLGLCRDYLSRYPIGARTAQVTVKMEACLFDDAVRSGTQERYFEYLSVYPTGHRDGEIRTRLEALIFRPLGEKEDFSAFDRYVRISYNSRDALSARMEPFMFEWARRVNRIDGYDRYLDRYPDGAHLSEVRAGMDPLLFKKAREEDWYSAYEEYIRKCPEGASVEKARERLAWLRDNPAVVEIDYPRVVEGSGYWRWETRFKEKSGKTGFRVTASGYILDPKWGKWGPNGRDITRSAVTAKAGSAGGDDFWCRSGDHAFCNGYAIFTWTGTDAGGHPLRFEEKVTLQHTGCPGHK